MKRQVSILGVLAFLLGGPWGAWAADLQTVIKGIDVVGLPASQAGELLRLLGLAEGMQVPYSRLKEAVVLPAESRLEGTGRFRDFSVRPTTFIGGDEDGGTYLTITVIERSSRFPAKTAPQGQLQLPASVQRFFAERVRALGAFRDTLLPSDQDRLEALSETHLDALMAALQEAFSPLVRSRAAQAIAFHPDAPRARKLLEDALRDPDPLVRRDVARALMPLIDRQIGREKIPLEPYLSLIRFPEPADRMNGAAMLLKLARLPEHRLPILREAGSALLGMARMKHPGERTLALEALQALSQAPSPQPWEAYRRLWEAESSRRFVD